MLDTAQSAELSATNALALAVMSAASSKQITTRAEYEQAAREHAAIHARCVALEKKRKTITEPMNLAKRNIDALFNEPKSRFESAKASLSEKMGAFDAAEQAVKDQALAVMATPDPERTVDEQRALVVVASEVRVPVAHVRPTITYDLEVVDEAALPRSVLSFDESKVKAMIKIDPTVQIAGLKITARHGVAATGR